MPYFERLPYAEMIRGKQSVSPETVPSSAGLSLVERAAAILKEESAGLPSASPAVPMTTAVDLARTAGISEQASGGRNIVSLEPPSPARAGETVKVTLSLVNDTGGSLSFSIVTTHLVSRSGARIAANNIDISPVEAVVGPSGIVDVEIAVRIPSIITPDEYCGLLQVYSQETLSAVLVVNVARTPTSAGLNSV